MKDPVMEFDPLLISNISEIEAEIQNRESGTTRTIDVNEMIAALKRRVLGQDHVVENIAAFIQVKWAQVTRRTPIACVMFVGPPGTGKTELATALVDYLYKGKGNALEINCNELKNGDSASAKLVGMPGVYKGAEAGKLTEPVIRNPKQVIIFDEIDKAAPSVHDLFLSMMGQGVLTDQKLNKQADFTQSIIVLTSNQLQEELVPLSQRITDPDELAAAVRGAMEDAEVFRPEIIDRFDQVYVFQPLAFRDKLKILAMKLSSFAKQYNLEIKAGAVEAKVLINLMNILEKRKGGIRDLQRVINERIGPLVVHAQNHRWKSIQLSIGNEGQVVIANGE